MNFKKHYARYVEKCAHNGEQTLAFPDWYVQTRVEQVNHHNAGLASAELRVTACDSESVELRPGLQMKFRGDDPYYENTSPDTHFHRVFVGDICYGTLCLSETRWFLDLGLPGHEIEYSAQFPTQQEAVQHVSKVLPVLVGVPRYDFDPQSAEATREALECAVMEIAPEQGDERAMDFLRAWEQGDHAKLHREWPDLPLPIFGTFHDSFFGNDEIYAFEIGDIPTGRPSN